MPTTSRTTLLLGPDYAAVLSRYASSISLKSHLSDISLANVLSGDTCSPISLADFEAYLAFSEHSLENLHFVVWFQDYRQRFFALPELVQATSPGPKAFSFSLPTPARTAQRIASSTQRTETCLFSPATSLSLASTSAASSPPYTPPAHQPFRAECARVAAAFLHPCAPKELPLDSALRDAILRDLTWNTHPDVFLPAYEETHDALASVSLPRFLAGAAANVNRPKQLFWYAAGLADTLLALILALIAAGRPARAWRLFAVPLAALGAMQAYSAWRGFCSQVWGRGGTQLRAWELQSTDVETPAEPGWDWSGAALSRATSVPDEKGKAREAPHESEKQQHQLQEAEGEKKDAPAPALRRPPVFGPERVVLDPRIRAVHRAVMRDILFVGFWWTLVFTVVVLAVPGVRRG